MRSFEAELGTGFEHLKGPNYSEFHVPLPAGAATAAVGSQARPPNLLASAAAQLRETPPEGSLPTSTKKRTSLSSSASDSAVAPESAGQLGQGLSPFAGADDSSPTAKIGMPLLDLPVERNKQVRSMRAEYEGEANKVRAALKAARGAATGAHPSDAGLDTLKERICIASHWLGVEPEPMSDSGKGQEADALVAAHYIEDVVHLES